MNTLMTTNQNQKLIATISCAAMALWLSLFFAHHPNPLFALIHVDPDHYVLNIAGGFPSKSFVINFLFWLILSGLIVRLLPGKLVTRSLTMFILVGSILLSFSGFFYLIWLGDNTGTFGG